MKRLADRVAIVSGAGQGVGRGIALALAREGAAVLIAELDAEKASRTAGEIEALGERARAVATDVRHRAQVEAAVAAAVESFGGVDILVNNAQTQHPPLPFEETTAADMESVVASGVLGTFHFMQACFPWLRRRGGKIINLASAAGLMGHAGFTSYAVAKEGIRALTKVAAREWGPHGIHVNVICPLAETPGSQAWSRAHPDRARAMLRTIPLGRLGDPETDIGRAVVFLASPDSDYVTGLTMMIDGGQTILH